MPRMLCSTIKINSKCITYSIAFIVLLASTIQGLVDDCVLQSLCSSVDTIYAQPHDHEFSTSWRSSSIASLIFLSRGISSKLYVPPMFGSDKDSPGTPSVLTVSLHQFLCILFQHHDHSFSASSSLVLNNTEPPSLKKTSHRILSGSYFTVS